MFAGKEIFGRNIFGGRVEEAISVEPKLIEAAPLPVPFPTQPLSGYAGIVAGPGAARPWMTPVSFNGSPDGLGSYRLARRRGY